MLLNELDSCIYNMVNDRGPSEPQEIQSCLLSKYSAHDIMDSTRWLLSRELLRWDEEKKLVAVEYNPRSRAEMDLEQLDLGLTESQKLKIIKCMANYAFAATIDSAVAKESYFLATKQDSCGV